jgi:hypothetical protein
MMKRITPGASVPNRGTLRRNSDETKTIAPLPLTTLKYRGDTPEPPADQVDQMAAIGSQRPL